MTSLSPLPSPPLPSSPLPSPPLPSLPLPSPPLLSPPLPSSPLPPLPSLPLPSLPLPSPPLPSPPLPSLPSPPSFLQPPELPVEEEEWYYGDIDRKVAESKCKNRSISRVCALLDLFQSAWELIGGLYPLRSKLLTQ